MSFNATFYRVLLKKRKMDLAASSLGMSCDLEYNPDGTHFQDGFSCVISMHDGVVMYATSSLTTTLGFPKDMWIGRSFIDFVHPRVSLSSH